MCYVSWQDNMIDFVFTQIMPSQDTKYVSGRWKRR